MKIRKTVTEKKRMANRGNAKKSRGPKTERGKKHSRFNAIKGGLFAKFLVMWTVDGNDGEGDFAKLHANLKREYRPQGPTEAYYLEEMAKSMWRIRRATRYEHGLLKERTLGWDPDRPPEDISYDDPDLAKLHILISAQEEIDTTGTLSLAAYQAVLPLLTHTGQEAPPVFALGSGDVVRSDEGISRAEPKIGRRFLTSLKRKVESQDSSYHRSAILQWERFDDYNAARALPSELEMKKIFGCEKASQNQFDWALRGLLESQERRKKVKMPSTI